MRLENLGQRITDFATKVNLRHQRALQAGDQWSNLYLLESFPCELMARIIEKKWREAVLMCTLAPLILPIGLVSNAALTYLNKINPLTLEA